MVVGRGEIFLGAFIQVLADRLEIRSFASQESGLLRGKLNRWKIKTRVTIQIADV